MVRVARELVEAVECAVVEQGRGEHWGQRLPKFGLQAERGMDWAPSFSATLT